MKIVITIAVFFSVRAFGFENIEPIRFHLACDPKTECRIIPVEGGLSIHLEKNARVLLTPSDVISVETNLDPSQTKEFFTIKMSEGARVKYSAMTRDNAGVNFGIMYGEQLMVFGPIPEGSFDGLLQIESPLSGSQSLRKISWLMERVELTRHNKLNAKRIGVLSYAILTLLFLALSLWWIYRRRKNLDFSKNEYLLFAGVIFSMVLGGCASAPELANYPRASIDRPYTLPKPIATWSTVVPFGYYQDNTSSSFMPPIPVPLYWRTSLSNHWNLNWAPLPTSASYQIEKSKSHTLGLTFGAGYGYATGSIGFVFEPGASFFWREKVSPEIALELEPHVVGGFYSGGATSTWNAEVEVGPAFQLTPVFALRTKITLSVSNGARPLVAIAPSILPSNSVQVTFPISVSTVWSIDRQWDLNFGYRFTQIGYTNGYSGHTGNVTAVYYW